MLNLVYGSVYEEGGLWAAFFVFVGGEWAGKPGSVADGHLSRIRVAAHL